MRFLFIRLSRPMVVVSGFPLAAVPGILDSVCRRDIVPNPTFTTSSSSSSLRGISFSFWEKKERKKFATSPSVETRAGQSGNNAEPSTKALGNNT